MSELVHMRHRMKAVKTIQKITRAMCLVSMSTHTRLRGKRQFLEIYHNSLNQLFIQLRRYEPEWSLLPTSHASNRILLIIIGSQKGLCGTFNATLATFVQQQSRTFSGKTIDLITIGAHQLAETIGPIGTLIKQIPTVSLSQFSAAAHQCAEIIMHASPPYETVLAFGNYSKSFFMQKPRLTQIFPLEEALVEPMGEPDDDLIWEQPVPFLLNAAAEQLLEARLQKLIFESLLAEQAARFIAMDAATRNAHSLLTNMRLAYNKIRQAKITRELTDLIGSFF